MHLILILKIIQILINIAMYTIGIQAVKKGGYIEKIFPIVIMSLEITTMKAKEVMRPLLLAFVAVYNEYDPLF